MSHLKAAGLVRAAAEYFAQSDIQYNIERGPGSEVTGEGFSMEIRPFPS